MERKRKKKSSFRFTTTDPKEKRKGGDQASKGCPTFFLESQFLEEKEPKIER